MNVELFNARSGAARQRLKSAGLPVRFNLVAKHAALVVNKCQVRSFRFPMTTIALTFYRPWVYIRLWRPDPSTIIRRQSTINKRATSFGQSRGFGFGVLNSG